MAHRTRTRAAAAAAALVVAALVAALATGCGAPSATGPVDPQRLSYELASVVRLDKLRQGFEFDVAASCAEGAPGRFACRVEALKPGQPVNAWTENVTCRPSPDAWTYRCVSDEGFALQ